MTFVFKAGKVCFVTYLFKVYLENDCHQQPKGWEWEDDDRGQPVVRRLRERFADLVFASTIRENGRLAEAPSFEQPITSYAPDSTGAADYRAVAAELFEREQGRTVHEQTTTIAGR